MLNLENKQYFLNKKEKIVLIPSKDTYISSVSNGDLFQKALGDIKESSSKILHIDGNTFTVRFAAKSIRKLGFSEEQFRSYNIAPMYYFEDRRKIEEEHATTGISEDYIVQFKNASTSYINRILKKYDSGIIRPFRGLKNTYLVRYFGADLQKVFDIPNQLVEEGIATYAHPDFHFRIKPNSPSMLPPDPEFDDQWALLNDGQFSGTIDEDIQMTEGWELLRQYISIQQENDVNIAVLDDGVLWEHEDFRNRLTNGYNIFTATHDNNSFPPYAQATNPTHIDHHGTAIATIIVANMNNIGTVGTSPNSMLIPIKMRYNYSTTTSSGIVDAIQKAIEKNARVINMSWSLYTAHNIPLIENKIIDTIYYHQITFCCAAGNYFTINDASVEFPGNMEEVITVAACNHKGEWINPDNTEELKPKYIPYAFGSCFGPSVDVCAPGVIIVAIKPTRWDSKYFYFAGTSAATAFVSGVAGLLYALDNSITPIEVKRILKDTADPNIYVDYSGPISVAEFIGSGRINARAAIAETIREFNIPPLIL